LIIVIKESELYRALGIMSGTSLDGLDLALCSFKRYENRWEFAIEDSQIIEYPDELVQRLNGAYTASASELAQLDTYFGRFIGEQAKTYLANKGKIDLIASHGQTIFHKPADGYTYQIGKGAEIAAKSGVVTVCDFRSSDVAHGGLGAPLVPLGDKLLFEDYSACVNLGGFANISYKLNGEYVAFDISPLNFVLNRLAHKLGKKYDEDGEFSSKGATMLDLYVKLNSLPYYNAPAPKTLGHEWVEENVFDLLKGDFDVKNVMRTFCEHVSHQVSRSLEHVKGENILFTGGGVRNRFLMKLIGDKTKKRIIVPELELVDMKEALIFAFLGVLRVRGEVNSIASVTGASKDVINGAVYLP